MIRKLNLLLILLVSTLALNAQITAPSAGGNTVTDYPAFGETDNIFLFCGNDATAENGALTVTTDLSGTKTFLWEKYNPTSGDFELEIQESSSDATSQISGLSDGCYRATVTLGGTIQVHRAWVFNNWTTAEASIGESNCESLTLNGTYTTATLTYYDLSNNTPVNLAKDTKFEWFEGSTKIGGLINLQLFTLPAENTTFRLVVSDKFGCESYDDVLYESVVTEASFTYTQDPSDKEAPSTVTFTNTSTNGTSGAYEWFFYRNLDEIKQEAENGNTAIDSVDFVAYDDAPVWTYENSGQYFVKLVSKNVSENITCVDTFILEKPIEVDTSFVIAPNVFTPNGDGVNDEFVIKYWSMKRVEINIFNRWGRKVHSWKRSNVEGFEATREESVWDGKVNGGKMASPGVYYYDVVGRGRDGKKRSTNGFVHLFRDK